MVGIFSKFSTSKIGHRRTQSALDESEVLPQNSEVPEANLGTFGAAHGIEVAVEFKPIEHPTEPLDNDEPIECPRPEPSILNGQVFYPCPSFEALKRDGSIWKERVSAANVRRRSDLPLVKEGVAGNSGAGAGTRPHPPSNRMILPSLSAPEHNIVNLLEEYNASGGSKHTVGSGQCSSGVKRLDVPV
ncbi:hypothetical protein Cgig2_023055 [Carnegiea gigantea]|uniref:Uncharacterized protein n=1 Tax=Carnegiea gigantea TaxID=171969 RepID=A0A9Q1JXZ6_9CARY|nr:hypothetical protein Cgig2_023055 [Carnegiea gigantea]